MIDVKSMSMAKMNALRHVVEVMKYNAEHGGQKQILLKDIVDEAEKLTSWILNPHCKYIVDKVKETK